MNKIREVFQKPRARLALQAALVALVVQLWLDTTHQAVDRAILGALVIFVVVYVWAGEKTR